MRAPGVTAEQLVAANAAAWATYWPEVEDHWVLGRLDDATLGHEAWARTLWECGIDDQELVALADAAFREAMRSAWRLFPDAEPALRSVRDAGIPTALITNGGAATQRAKVEALGLAPRFDAIVISGEHGVAKPDPAVFSIALDALGIGAARSWHVGDSLAADVAGAQAAGLAAVWLNRRGGTRTVLDDPVPDAEISSLRDLMPAMP